MNVDLSNLVGVLLSLASAAVTSVIPVLLPVLLRRMHVATDTDLARRIEAATNAAAGVAYQYAMTRAGGLGDAQVHNAAVARGADYVAEHVPDSLRGLGVKPDSVVDMVSARLGTLLAADPTVSAGTPVQPQPGPPVPVFTPTNRSP